MALQVEIQKGAIIIGARNDGNSSSILETPRMHSHVCRQSIFDTIPKTSSSPHQTVQVENPANAPPSLNEIAETRAQSL